MNAENVDQIFGETPSLEERLTAIELRLSKLEQREIVLKINDSFQLTGDEVYSQPIHWEYSDSVKLVDISHLNKAEARIAELEAELKQLRNVGSVSGISPIKLEPLAIYPL